MTINQRDNIIDIRGNLTEEQVSVAVSIAKAELYKLERESEFSLTSNDISKEVQVLQYRDTTQLILPTGKLYHNVWYRIYSKLIEGGDSDVSDSIQL